MIQTHTDPWVLMDFFVKAMFSEASHFFLETDDEINAALFSKKNLGSAQIFMEALEWIERVLSGEESDELGFSTGGTDFVEGKKKPRCQGYADNAQTLVEKVVVGARETRNKSWEQRLQEKLKSEDPTMPFFVCVGLNHLGGETGILKTLERYGVTSDGIEQLMSDSTWRAI
ncbi:hypothetical protein OAN21_01555 [Alphaproteobacteria bacterium]|nr:hypothetical protein [Alphaproteobacteria bacterium]